MIALSPVRHLPQNGVGRDYVVGDLHGCFDLLERLLIEVNFDTACDRLFSVGDLIDRGPNSLRCLQLLAEPWFYAVQGNHELMMRDCFLSYLHEGKLESIKDDGEISFLDNGGDWVERYFQPDDQCMSDEFNRCLDKVLAMPLIWVVGEGGNRFNVIHAELVNPDYPTSGHRVWLDADIDQWHKKGIIPIDSQDRLVWGRMLMEGKTTDRIQKGLSTTFCGHTFETFPRQVLSHLCIDTGAFFSLYAKGYGLTLFNVREASWLRASYEQAEITTGGMSTI